MIYVIHFSEFVRTIQYSEDIADEMIEKYFPEWFHQNVSRELL
jgi:hypothetical protein